ncbi:MAG: hypothetical protein ABSH17_09770 [Syntrophobacteraceae bacterium]
MGDGLTCRCGRPGKPTSRSEAGRSPAKRDLYTIAASLSDTLNIWLAFKRTTSNVRAFCMAARTVAALIISGAFFFRVRYYINLSYEGEREMRWNLLAIFAIVFGILLIIKGLDTLITWRAWFFCISGLVLLLPGIIRSYLVLRRLWVPKSSKEGKI